MLSPDYLNLKLDLCMQMQVRQHFSPCQHTHLLLLTVNIASGICKSLSCEGKNAPD